jgi:hypothetical protein
MAHESYDEAYRRGFDEGKGIRNPPNPPPPMNQSTGQAHQAGLAEGRKSSGKTS